MIRLPLTEISLTDQEVQHHIERLLVRHSLVTPFARLGLADEGEDKEADEGVYEEADDEEEEEEEEEDADEDDDDDDLEDEDDSQDGSHEDDDDNDSYHASFQSFNSSDACYPSSPPCDSQSDVDSSKDDTGHDQLSVATQTAQAVQKDNNLGMSNTPAVDTTNIDGQMSGTVESKAIARLTSGVVVAAGDCDSELHCLQPRSSTGKEKASLSVDVTMPLDCYLSSRSINSLDTQPDLQYTDSVLAQQASPSVSTFIVTGYASSCLGYLINAWSKHRAKFSATIGSHPGGSRHLST